MDSKKILTTIEAYDAMYDYLTEYYNKNKSDDVGGLLSDMLLLADGTSADSASLMDWHESVDKIVRQKQNILPMNFMNSKKTLTIDEAYDTVIDYLAKYNKRGYSDDIGSILDDMLRLDNGKNTNQETLIKWRAACAKILTQTARVRPFFGETNK